MSNTIYALASARGRAGLAVIRVSGPGALGGLEVLSGDRPGERQVAYRTFKDPVSRETIDHGVALYFKGPKSFTGEDTVEYHLHGGPAVVSHMLEALSQMKGHRLAEPGEFTRRAFENGKMDLTEAEAVADLVDAETAAQKAQALAQVEGALSRLYESWAKRLTRALAHLEAAIEFPYESLPEGTADEVIPVLSDIAAEIAAHLNDNRRGERLRDGIHIAVIGAPNAGKSTLVNALARRDVAIVSDLAGTTRDVIEVHLDLGGYPVILSDTAGLRPDQIGARDQDKIESEGIRRALKRAEEADIKLLLFDGTAKSANPDTAKLIASEDIIVITKKDCCPDRSEAEWRDLCRVYWKRFLDFVRDDVLIISASENEGLNELSKAIIAKIETLLGKAETPSLTRQRHRAALEECRDSLTRALKAELPELRGEDIRLAVRALGRITGRVDVEDLLDVIFRDFCIGK